MEHSSRRESHSHIMEELHTTDNFFNHPHYRLVKFLGEITGIWPYPTLRRKICFPLFVIAFILQFTCQILGVIHYRNKSDIVLAAIPTIIVDTGCLFKFLNILIQWEKIQQLLELMKEDWKLVNIEEKKILNKYANLGQILATLYIGTVYAGVVSFITEPRLSAIIEGLLNPNYTKPEEELLYATPMAFGGLNLDGYHYIAQAISYVCCLSIMTIMLCNDALFIVYMQHICGRFKGLGHRIKNLPITATDSEDDGYEYICECITIHNRVIEFSEIVESLNEWCFLLIVGMNMLMLSITAVQAVTQMNSIPSFIKFSLFTSTQILHLFFECFMSQQLIDHSSNIRSCLLEAKWHENTLKTQKAIVFMLMRSQVPCRLTAGRVVEMSMETFSSMMKTSVSYFTVFLSMQ